MRGARANGARRRGLGETVPTGVPTCFAGCKSAVALLLSRITCGVVNCEQENTGDDFQDVGEVREPNSGVRRPKRGSQGSRDGSLTAVAEPTEDTASGTTPMPDLRAATVASEAASPAAGASGFSAARTEGDHTSSSTRGDAQSVRKGHSVRSGDPQSGAVGSVNDGMDGSEVASQNEKSLSGILATSFRAWLARF